jgi:hypothetical protein
LEFPDHAVDEPLVVVLFPFVQEAKFSVRYVTVPPPLAGAMPMTRLFEAVPAEFAA